MVDLEKRQVLSDIINYCEGEKYIDLDGNDVLVGGTIEYENKHKYEIGFNMALQYVIRYCKSLQE